MQWLLRDNVVLSWNRLIVFWFLFCCTEAALQHAPENITSASESTIVGWQSNPSRRGTMDIVQSCAFTILICTWSVQHLNVPDPSETSGQILRRKIRWMIITVLIPEFVLAHAIMERDMAFKSMRHLKGLDNFKVDDRPWWKVWSSSSSDQSSEPVAANPTEPENDIQPISIIRTPSETSLPQDLSRNADIEVNPSTLNDQEVRKSSSNSISQPDDQDQQLGRTSSASKEPLQWTLLLSYYANMGGLRIRFPSTPGSGWWTTPRKDGYSINTEQLSILLRQGHIDVDELSDLSIDTTVDKSKGDFFTKGLAIVQVLWLMITLLIRASRDVAITQLEILAVAFAICSTVTYGFWWNKPQDVHTAITIPACSHCENVTQWHVESIMTEMFDSRTDSIVIELIRPLSTDTLYK
ncbi:hypothetical protein MMC07_007154 [Pseudocyphellaria aurata]|nr:hypothetical protein [Pseudocyphellaria aurata]